MPKQYHCGNPHGDRIIKLLNKITTSGNRPDVIFEDWLQIVEATLTAAPDQVSEIALSAVEGPDTPETAKLFAHLRDRYSHPSYFHAFAESFAILLDSVTPDDPQDVLGGIYMAWGWPSDWAGQFFTPMPIAKAMAQMTLQGAEAQVHARLKTAIEQSPAAQAALLAGLGLDGDEARDWFTHRVVPLAIPHYQPLTVNDPCCGSGVMFLAAASCLPSWMTQLGLVQFSGQDIDAGCVRMTRINIMLYGLNGWGARWTLAAAEAIPHLNATPSPEQSRRADQAPAAPESDPIAQLSLFP